jgi:hypothetical protein
MPALRTLLPLAAALAAAAPAGASAAPARGGGPGAHAAGGDVPPVIPAVVRTHVKRAESAVDRLGGNVDDDDAAGATRTGQLIRRQVAAAWRGVKYYIKHAPPPPADDARLKPARARAAGGGPAAPVPADPPTVALAVFGLQDDVVSGIVALFDGASAPVLQAIKPTLADVLDRRDAAVQDVHALAPAPAADDARARPVARAAGGAVVNTFDTVMPQVPPMLDDELQQIGSLKSDAESVLPAGRRLLRSAAGQIAQTEHQIDAYWPPVSGEG